jgi:DNA modification methylase
MRANDETESAPFRPDLYFGDNLHVLRQHINDETVDLVYLDPPFNSKANYNMLYKEPSGRQSVAQVRAFEDTWHWGDDASNAFEEVLASKTPAAGILRSLHSFLGPVDLMAYLTMMTVRLIELHRVLKPTGSLYLHCDPTASHYLKIILDAIFGPACFRTEISWKRQSAHNDAKQGRKQYGNIRDVLFFYTKCNTWTWHWQYTAYDQKYVDDFYKHVDPGTNRRYRLSDITGPGGAAKGNPRYEVMGVTRYWRYSKERMAQMIKEGRIVQTRPGAVPVQKRYLDEMPGVGLQNDWNDILPASGRESLGYPTQKPLALLERIVEASSNPGDVILDPFCGCGTTIHAALTKERRCIGIDVTHIAIQVILDRIKKYFPAVKPRVFGRPEDLEGARELARQDKYEFQWWAASLIGGQARGGNKKGADRGVDGEIFFKRGSDEYGRAIISVKGGDNLSPSMIRDLAGTRDQEGADMGIFICLKDPSPKMRSTAAGYGHTKEGYPRVAIVTIDELLRRQNQFALPPSFDTVTVRDEARRRGQTTKVRKPEELRAAPEFMWALGRGDHGTTSARDNQFLPTRRPLAGSRKRAQTEQLPFDEPKRRRA